ncbi:MAG: hypothetical protein A2074_03155 [Candidatus Aquicultor primus]|uniref:Uncharacterized protein n=1 Tax=Candidatus Aquicultor primus TaxID=1797195 RepID=A0A1F2URD5_9ACTN|nr:MAG: hypothetical protein A2074_03155 [Candidatus Aquicultor primus]
MLEHEPHPPPKPLLPPEANPNDEKSFLIWVFPHLAQAGVSAYVTGTNLSKTHPHFSHLNSYMGIKLTYYNYCYSPVL